MSDNNLRYGNGDWALVDEWQPRAPSPPPLLISWLPDDPSPSSGDPATDEILTAAEIIVSMSQARCDDPRAGPGISNNRPPSADADSLQHALLPRQGTRSDALEYGPGETASESMSTTSFDSQETVETPSEEHDGESPSGSEQELAEGGLLDEAPSPSRGSGIWTHWGYSSPSGTRHELDQEPVLAEHGNTVRREEATGRLRHKSKMDIKIQITVADYMEKSGGDISKAADAWFEREESKNRQPWPRLEEANAFVAKMKQGSLYDPKPRRQLEGEEQLSPMIRDSRRRHTALGTTSLNPKRQAPVPGPINQRAKSRQPMPTMTANNVPSTPRTPSAAPEKQLAAWTAPRGVEVPSTPAHNSNRRPTRPRQPVSSPISPVKRKRRAATDNLESDLGERWKPSVTRDGHRPCSKTVRNPRPLDQGRN